MYFPRFTSEYMVLNARAKARKEAESLIVKLENINHYQKMNESEGGTGNPAGTAQLIEQIRTYFNINN